MRRIALFIATVVLSTPLFAMHCPADMARIDALLESNPPTDAATLEQVQTLRVEGEHLHNVRPGQLAVISGVESVGRMCADLLGNLPKATSGRIRAPPARADHQR